jgi:hypothetical protein
LNHPNIKRDFKAVSERISARLAEMERPGGWMSKTDNFYFKSTGSTDTELEDAANETYRPIGMAKLWDNFIFDKCTEQIAAFNTFVAKGVTEVSKIANDAQKDTKTSATEKKRMRDRASKLQAAAKMYGKALVAVDKKP